MPKPCMKFPPLQRHRQDPSHTGEPKQYLERQKECNRGDPSSSRPQPAAQQERSHSILYRAYQQDPEHVEEWKKVIYPKIRKLAAEEGANILFEDEAGLRTDHHAGTTWGLSGTPRSW